MMAAKFMHVNLRSIISTSTTSTPTSSASASASASATTSPLASPTRVTPFNNVSVSAERSTIHKYTQSLPPITSTTTNNNQKRQEQLPSPPTSPKAFASDPLNYHYFQSSAAANITATSNTIKQENDSTSPDVNHNERHFQILRMELEFLHFLNYDLSLSDTLKLIHWAQKFDDDLLPPIQSNYSSGDEGGDEGSSDDI